VKGDCSPTYQFHRAFDPAVLCAVSQLIQPLFITGELKQFCWFLQGKCCVLTSCPVTSFMIERVLCSLAWLSARCWELRLHDSFGRLLFAANHMDNRGSWLHKAVNVACRISQRPIKALATLLRCRLSVSRPFQGQGCVIEGTSSGSSFPATQQPTAS
jgi:hypothetical protein